MRTSSTLITTKKDLNQVVITHSNEEEYIISKDDIDRLLDPPDINFSGGSRFYFQFKF